MIKLYLILLAIGCFSVPLTEYYNEEITYDKFYEEFENITLENDEYITVAIELKYGNTPNCENLSINRTRETNKEFYSENNNKKFEELFASISTSSYYISNYSPYIFLYYYNYEEYKNDVSLIKKISNTIQINKIQSWKDSDISVEESTINSAIANTTMYMDDALEIMKAKNTQYSGEGIKVGILEDGLPDDLTNFQNNEIKDYDLSDDSTPSTHCTKVSSIIGGTYGILPDADLYIAHRENANLSETIECFLDFDVDIINISRSYAEQFGLYSGYSAYLDFIIQQNYVTIVVAAGNKGDNEGDEANLIINPGLGLNVITVGETDVYQNISTCSSWDTDSSLDGIIMKPTVVAPAEMLYIPNTNNTGWGQMSGTSLSTPMVTGIIGLLMEEFPEIKRYPEVIMSTLVSSASPLPTQTTLWDEQAGAGMVNYEAAREILSSETYTTSSVSTQTDITQTIFSESVTVSPNSSVDFCLTSIQNSNISYSSNQTYTPNITNYDITVYDENNNVIETTKYGANSNLTLGTLANTTTSSKTYTITVRFRTIKNGNYPEFLCLSIYNHTHTYTYEYATYNSLSHKSYCYCKEFTLEGHSFLISTRPIKTCLKCGATVNTNSDIGIQQVTVVKTTINGSYILSNGLIYLVEEDVTPYLNGTLIFNNINASLS